MNYLLLAILCSGAIAIIFKYNENNGVNRLVVTTSNYFVAVIFTFIISINKTGKIISNIDNKMSILAVITGGLYFVCFIFYQKSIKNHGASITSIYSKFGVLLPMVFSMILWKEFPTIVQSIGLLTALIALFILNYSPDIHPLKNIKFLLVFLLILSGLGDFSNKLFQKYGNVLYKESFLSILFFSALVFSFLYSLKRVKTIKPRDILIGFLVGVPNLFSSFFLILALNKLKATLVFPLYSVGSMLVIILLSALIFKEKLHKKDWFSILLTCIALVLINI